MLRETPTVWRVVMPILDKGRLSLHASVCISVTAGCSELSFVRAGDANNSIQGLSLPPHVFVYFCDSQMFKNIHCASRWCYVFSIRVVFPSTRICVFLRQPDVQNHPLWAGDANNSIQGLSLPPHVLVYFCDSRLFKNIHCASSWCYVFSIRVVFPSTRICVFLWQPEDYRVFVHGVSRWWGR